ncbi:nuclear transport factor 2 family protein [Nocardia farcinica]|uniref:nuclear transport factor 2 family protein n=1 Tax=Nocardia farcinica TaxID=37329 RepID=UPI000A38A492|nr:limonene-1,2-epoxide hydrolase family protein [Nocardia farcinica]MBA4857490.1 nuclear transport factor 2 family protein [Nocardia farcinica]MBC9816211.1 nuclear transport factor 2 family protein [Nocardia farcinica]MBF6072442.1 nuclear transport factor 2 family protein [Nocardia farcinica]MBF6262386.1 nuclear transport factor 2 family protein [Nocardia farcinica]MBF6280926.1 nuclear transport factor 2 family protein [Nocardia farcinica]
MTSSELPAAISDFLAAVDARDAAAAGRTFTEDISYQLLVPYPPVVGRAAVVAALDKSLTEADRVRWEVVSFAVNADLALVERVDRFWFGDREAAIECTGVFQLRDGLIAAVRDYADLGTWRERKTTALRGE